MNMPRVGKMKFSYSEGGQAMARYMAKMTGQPITSQTPKAPSGKMVPPKRYMKPKR